jgi:hypothetical protein
VAEAEASPRAAWSDRPSGAYGLAVHGLEPCRRLLPIAGHDWPAVRIESRRRENGERPPQILDDDQALIWTRDGGHAMLDRRRGTATAFHATPLGPEELVHPLLAYAGAVFGGWMGRYAFHAGTLVADGRAWAMLGGTQSGKSTLLAAVAGQGYEVLADDTLIVDGGERAFAGPRCIDLRDPAPEILGVRDRVSPVRTPVRYRMTVPPIASEVPLGGWIHLAWGSSVAVNPIPLGERLARLSRLRAWQPERDALAMLDLAALPAFELRRPRSWDLLPRAAEAVLETVRG